MHTLQNDGLRQLLVQHSRVFQQGVGTITRYKADIHLKEGATSIIRSLEQSHMPPTTVGYRARKATAGRNSETSANESVGNPFSACMVVPKANGKIRVCVNYV